MATTSITCASWNVHRAKGQDGVVSPSRVMGAIEAVLCPEAPDVLTLQEADTECPPHASILDVARIAAATGLDYQHDARHLRWGPRSDGFLGTILWMHPRFRRSHADVIDLPGHCHRGVIAAEYAADGTAFRMVSGHLSLSQPLRIVQMRIIGQYLFRRPKMQTIILGDLNEWRPWGGIAFSKHVLGETYHAASAASFPTKRPFLPLDRVLTNRADAIESFRVLDAPETNAASDHRPIVAQVRIPDGPAREG